MSAPGQETEIIDFVIDRNPSPISIIDTSIGDIFISPPIANINTSRRCSFCECPGHTIRNCSHSDINKLHRAAQFIYLTTCRYLKIRPNTENTHKEWLNKLTTSEYKILAKLIRLDTNSRTKRNEYQTKLHTYYVEYAVNELRNDNSTNAMSIYSMFSANLFQGIDITTEETARYAIYTLESIIKASGRQLLDMSRLRQWLCNRLQIYIGNQVLQPRYFENYLTHRQLVIKQLPTLTHIPSLVNQLHDECPICYTLMTNDTTVQLGCSHSFCGDCIIRQIKSSKNSTSDCAMCRSTINSCSSACEKILQKISNELK